MNLLPSRDFVFQIKTKIHIQAKKKKIQSLIRDNARKEKQFLFCFVLFRFSV